ncbi:MAG: chemotaxis protein CheW [Clostridium sp.]
MKSCKVVIFKINNEEYAADIMQVERILEYIEPTRIPDSPNYVKGIIDYQNSVLPVIDMKKRFSLEDTGFSEESKIIVVKSNGSYIGISVDMVLEVMDITEDKIEDTPHIAMKESNKYIKSIFNQNNRIIIFLDTDAIIQTKELKVLAKRP